MPRLGSKWSISPESNSGTSGLLFDFNQTLRGRKRRLEALNAFLNDPKNGLLFFQVEEESGKPSFAPRLGE